jgi:ATP-dependent RNA helicase RhlB
MEGKTRFHDLNLRAELMHAIFDLGFQYCTPVQAEALPAALAGRDVAGRAQTGTGKTAAFLVGIFQHMLHTPPPPGRPPGSARALVLAPTRELVMQIEKDARAIGAYCPFRAVAVYGGTELDKQRQALCRGQPDLVIATPGRLLDFSRRHCVHLGQVEILIIDEADRMLDMGFIPDVRSIVYRTPRKERRQTMLFSATLSDTVTRLASSWTRNPVRVNIDPEQVAVDTVEQVVYIVTSRQKFALLYNLLKREHLQRVLLFANRRDTAARLTHELKRHGVDCALISGALAQEQRTRTLQAFREGRVRILVATDVASRGLHVEGIGHVINYNLPTEPEDYVHRIGRTGRAGARGASVSFACEDEAMYIPDIEKFIGRPLACVPPPDEWLQIPADVKPAPSWAPPAPAAHPGFRGRRRAAGRPYQHRRA